MEGEENEVKNLPATPEAESIGLSLLDIDRKNKKRLSELLTHLADPDKGDRSFEEQIETLNVRLREADLRHVIYGKLVNEAILHIAREPSSEQLTKRLVNLRIMGDILSKERLANEGSLATIHRSVVLFGDLREYKRGEVVNGSASTSEIAGVITNILEKTKMRRVAKSKKNEKNRKQ